MKYILTTVSAFALAGCLGSSSGYYGGYSDYTYTPTTTTKQNPWYAPTGPRGNRNVIGGSNTPYGNRNVVSPGNYGNIYGNRNIVGF